MEEALSHQTSTTTRDVFNLMVINRDGGQDSTTEAFDCISNLQTGNFTVRVREIECSGGIGLKQFNHQHIRVQGFLDGIHKCMLLYVIHGACLSSYHNSIDTVSSNTVTRTSTVIPGETGQETRANTQAIGFSVAIGVLIITGVLLLVILIVVAITRKQKNSREVVLNGTCVYRVNIAY